MMEMNLTDIGALRGYLFVPFDCRWNGLVREITAAVETEGMRVDPCEVFKRLVSFVRDNGQLDRTFPERSRLLELFITPESSNPNAKDDDNYVAFLCFQRHEEKPSTIHVCDSDTKGAFKVYRHPLLADRPEAPAQARAAEVKREE